MSRPPDGLVEVAAGDRRAGGPAVLDAVALAHVVGDLGGAAGVVADGHPQPAAAADDEALQQGGTLSGRPGGAVAAVRGGVGRQPGDVGLVLVESDVSGVGAGDEAGPLVAGELAGGGLPAGPDLVGGPAVGERACVAGVVQHPQHGVVAQRLPVGLALAGSFLVPPGEGQPGGAERLHHGGGRPRGLERGEQVPERALDGGVGIEDDVPGGVVGQADRERHDQLAAAGLGQLTAAQPGLDEVELAFGHGPLEAQQHPVVEAARVVEAVLVADQGAGHGAQLEELVPVGVVAGQPGAFQAEHDPGPAQRHLGDHLLEPFPVRSRRAGVALVDVDHGDLAGVPAQRDRLAAQVVLADRRLGVVDDLLEAGLPDVEHGLAGQVGGGHFRGRGIGEHRVSFGKSSG